MHTAAQLHRRALAACRRRWLDRDGIEDAAQEAVARWLALPAERQVRAAPWVVKWAVHLLSPTCRRVAARRLRWIGTAQVDLDASPRIRTAMGADESGDAGFVRVLDMTDALAGLQRGVSSSDAPSSLPPVDAVARLLGARWTLARIGAALGVSGEAVRRWGAGSPPRAGHRAGLARLLADHEAEVRWAEALAA